MHLTDEQLGEYRERGFLFLPGLLSQGEIERMGARLPALFAEDTPRRVLEKDGVTVRSVYGSHRHEPMFDELIRDPRLLAPAEQIVAADVYVHQFKINSKLAFGGDLWAWHQDFIFWEREDGIARPDLVTVALFLDEVNEFNGPLALIEGSHKVGIIDVAPAQTPPSQYEQLPDWISSLTTDIKYSVPPRKVAELSGKGRMIAPKGPAGSVLLFHPNVVHGSTSNISPFDRAVVLVTYNSTANPPRADGKLRPDFLCSRDFSAVKADECVEA